MIEFRRLGRSDIKVSPLGLGTARMAGMGWHDDRVPDNDKKTASEAVRQIQAAVDLGVTIFDTANNYGQGLSESILGQALQGRREKVVVVTKFGEDPIPELPDPWSLDKESIVRLCDASLRRLGGDRIDLYLLHRRDYPIRQAPAVMEVLEALVTAGKIRFYGWSTDDVERAMLFSKGKHCTAIEHRLNIINDNAAMLDLCREQDLASLNRGPLLMGVLSGSLSPEKKLEEDDPRAEWFTDEEFLRLLECVKQMKPFLTSGGRSCTQGALGWIWARSPVAIPLPGFRTMGQMQELVQAQQFGPLPTVAMQSISEKLQGYGFSGN
jgi:aryl-alcohol dehydrogenase-like predicted oxidoreductase